MLFPQIWYNFFTLYGFAIFLWAYALRPYFFFSNLKLVTCNLQLISLIGQLVN